MAKKQDLGKFITSIDIKIDVYRKGVRVGVDGRLKKEWASELIATVRDLILEWNEEAKLLNADDKQLS